MSETEDTQAGAEAQSQSPPPADQPLPSDQDSYTGLQEDQVVSPAPRPDYPVAAAEANAQPTQTEDEVGHPISTPGDDSAAEGVEGNTSTSQAHVEPVSEELEGATKVAPDEPFVADHEKQPVAQEVVNPPSTSVPAQNVEGTTATDEPANPSENDPTTVTEADVVPTPDFHEEPPPRGVGSLTPAEGAPDPHNVQELDESVPTANVEGTTAAEGEVSEVSGSQAGEVGQKGSGEVATTESQQSGVSQDAQPSVGQDPTVTTTGSNTDPADVQTYDESPAVQANEPPEAPVQETSPQQYGSESSES